MMFRVLILSAICSMGFSANNNLLPNVQLTMSPWTMGEYGAFSLMGEMGPRNYRGSGTYGVYLSPCQRVKFSGEFLTQKLEYEFASGPRRKWVSQYALGGAYQFITTTTPLRSVDAGASYSHSFSKNLSLPTIGLEERIAGSSGGFAYLGGSVKLWKCGYFSGLLNYDHVKYRPQYSSHKKSVGFGGSMKFTQLLAEDVSLHATAEFRHPFDFYEGGLQWSPRFSNLGFTFGAFGNYTHGKNGVPHVVTATLQMGLSWGGGIRKCCRSEKDTAPLSQECYGKMYCDLTSWVSEPAVYLPVVLAVADQAALSCLLPTSTPIPDLMVDGRASIVDLSPYFSSSEPLTYSSPDLPEASSINPVTGVAAIGNLSDGMTYHVTIVATNSCGSTSQPWALIMTPPP